MKSIFNPSSKVSTQWVSLAPVHSKWEFTLCVHKHFTGPPLFLQLSSCSSYCITTCKQLLLCTFTHLSSQSLWFPWECPMVERSWSLHNITYLLLSPKWSIQGSKYSPEASPGLAHRLPPMCYKCHWHKQTYHWEMSLWCCPRTDRHTKAWKALDYLLLYNIISILFWDLPLFLTWVLRELQNSSGTDTTVLDCCYLNISKVENLERGNLFFPGTLCISCKYDICLINRRNLNDRYWFFIAF